MRPKKIRAEKVMHTRKGWKHTDDMKRLRIIMVSVAAAAIVFIAAAGVVIWMMLQGNLQSGQGTVQSNPAQTSGAVLPVYDDSFNLVLVNKNRQLKSDFSVQLTEFRGVQIEERILPALEKMLEDAKRDGCLINITGGYVDKETQQSQYEQEVQRLMDSGGYTRIRAQEDAKATVQPGDYSELQTGMAVQLASAENPDVDFGTTKEFRWLEKNSIRYGFIQRYPLSKTTATGHIASNTQFRYVGTEPVSYTHLDVYKRQEVLCSKCNAVAVIKARQQPSVILIIFVIFILYMVLLLIVCL